MILDQTKTLEEADPAGGNGDPKGDVKDEGDPAKNGDPAVKGNGEAAPGKTVVTETKVEPLTLDALEWPKGTEEEPVEFDEPLRNEFVEILNDEELAKAVPKELRTAFANKLIGLQQKVMKAALERDSALLQETQDGWRKEVKETLGSSYDETLADIRKFIDNYKIEGFDDMLDLTGAGNHPAMVKFLTAVAKDFAEGKPKPGAPASEGKDPAATLFGNTAKG